MLARSAVFLLLGASALFFNIDAQSQIAQSSSSSHGGGGGGGNFMNLTALCDTSSDPTECLRRVAVCRRVHRTTARRPDQYHPSIVACAQELNITLPEVTEGANAYLVYRRWARSNPTKRVSIFNCIHSGSGTSDDTVNKTSLEQGVRDMLEGEDEPELLQELLDRVNSCHNYTDSRIQIYRCVFRGCATPQ